MLASNAMHIAHIDSDAFDHFLLSNYPRERELRNACFHAKKAYETGVMKGSLWRSYQKIKSKHDQIVSRAKARFLGTSPRGASFEDACDHEMDDRESEGELFGDQGDGSVEQDDEDEDDLPEPLRRLAHHDIDGPESPQKRPTKNNNMRKPVGSRPLKFLPPGGCGCSCLGVTCNFSETTYEIRRDMSTNKKCCIKCYQHQNKAWKATFEDYEIGKSSKLHACWLNQHANVRLYGLGRGSKSRVTE